jgi:hypothetical protein
VTKDEEIRILLNLLDKLKIYDIQLSHDDTGVLQAKDEDGNRWAGKEFYRFLTEECLCFGSDGNLAWGQYVPADILEPYKALSMECGVIPGHPEISMRAELEELEAYIQGTEMALDYGQQLPEGEYERYEAALARRGHLTIMLGLNEKPETDHKNEQKTVPKERGDSR